MLAPLQQQAGFQREGGERGVAAKNAGGQQQAQLRRRAVAQGKCLHHHAHQQGAADVDQKGRPGPGTADGDAGADQIAGVTQAGADTAAQEYQHIVVQRLHCLPRVRVRRFDGVRNGGQYLPSTNAGFVAAGAISHPRRLSGEPHPHRPPCYQHAMGQGRAVITTRATLPRLTPSISRSWAISPSVASRR
ncbi:hypothetical protein D3C72_1223700 [compost metagenome]